eukprot:6892197-Ditylum_brightwellii.AAC.1
MLSSCAFLRRFIASASCSASFVLLAVSLSNAVLLVVAAKARLSMASFNVSYALVWSSTVANALSPFDLAVILLIVS